MFYSILARILRKHAFFHLLIPLLVGVVVEALYAYYVDRVGTAGLPDYLLSSHRIALYAGIFIAYVVVIGFLIRSETNIGSRRRKLDALAEKLRGVKSLFVVAPTPFEEWFDPAAQVYLATIYGARLNAPFRYERVILLPGKNAERNLDSDYLDGYHAKCLLDIHRCLNIELYLMYWKHINRVLRQLSIAQLVLIGYYPRFLRPVPEIAKEAVRCLMWPIRRRRVRHIAGGVIEDQNGIPSVFLFEKEDNVVDVDVEPDERSAAYIEFVKKIREQIYQPGTTIVKPNHTFKI